MKRAIINLLSNFLFVCFHLFPLRNKVVASTFKGKKYGDNPQYIFEALHRISPDLGYYWMLSTESISVPIWINKIPYRRTIKTIYHICTSKVVVDTHRFMPWIKKRKGQLFIETWHGGLGIKKIEADVPAFLKNEWLMREVAHTNELADVFISQSDHLSNVYRSAFGYKGYIWKIGYPKNDILFSGRLEEYKKIRDYYNLTNDCKILLYVPSFRDYFYEKIDVSVYSINYLLLKKSLEKKFGGNWVILTRWHPLFAKELNNISYDYSGTINATSYPDIQELLKASDAVISDYSSCIFDAALMDIPCFTFATDFEKYKEDRGVYYEMEDLPFPYAINNEELNSNILTFNEEDYKKKWNEFKIRTGLYETGHASEDIAKKILEFIKTGNVEWK